MQPSRKRDANSNRSESSSMRNPQSQQEKKKPGRPPKTEANAAKKSPKKYEGAREVKDMLDFVKKNKTFKKTKQEL